MTGSGHVGSLVHRYFLGLIAVALPLLLLIAGLAVGQFRAERAGRLDTMARDAADLQVMLDGFLKSADDHVRQLRRSAEAHLSGLLPTAPSPLRSLIGADRWDSDGMRGEGLFLDGVAGTGMAELVGNLHGRSDLLAHRGSDDREIDMALGLFEPMHLAHLTAPHLRWSYYFSARGDFLTVYPYASGQGFIQKLGLDSVDDYLSAMYGYDVYRLSLPAVNPDRTGYWTPVYLDAGGAGWMVSHAAPVYAGGVFAGMVGTDVLLDFLSVFMAERHQAPGRALVIDERGDLLADSAGPVDRAVAVRRVGVALGGAPALPDLLAPSPAPRRIDGRELISRPLTAAPWHLVVVADESEITRLVLERLWPYALMLLGVLVALVLAQQAMQRFFVGPAIALAGRVREQSGNGGEPGEAPSVPELWRPWFLAVDEAFRSSRLSLARIREEQALKAAIVEATFDSIITIDEAGKVVEFSAGAETVFGYRRDEAMGQPISTLIVPPHLRGRHEEGLRRYIATGERHVLGRRIEIEGQRADGSIFPVELAIAEVRLPDRRLFTAYLRDITEPQPGRTGPAGKRAAVPRHRRGPDRADLPLRPGLPPDLLQPRACAAFRSRAGSAHGPVFLRLGPGGYRQGTAPRHAGPDAGQPGSSAREHEKALPSGERALVRLDQPRAVRRRRAAHRLPVCRARHQRGAAGAGGSSGQRRRACADSGLHPDRRHDRANRADGDHVRQPGGAAAFRAAPGRRRG